MSSVWHNNKLTVSIFGESHGTGIGVVIDGLPAGISIDLEALRAFQKRRAPGQNLTSTPRKESDLPEILSGILDGKTCGTPIAAVIRNRDTRSADYSQMSSEARPGHADYTGFLRYHGCNDPRGGGHFSGRLTAPLVFAGGICKQFLAQRGITVGAHILSIGTVADLSPDPVSVSPEELLSIEEKSFPVFSEERGKEMIEAVDRARMDQNSLGGVVECFVVGMPAGLGDPMFGGVENLISSAVFGIPAVKGIAFGEGFDITQLTGAEANDPFYICDDSGTVKTRTNHHGGILGGITSGMPIWFRTAFKPTASISRPQNTIDFLKHQNTVLAIKGRHDPCIVPRAVPCVEAAAAMALASLFSAD